MSTPWLAGRHQDPPLGHAQVVGEPPARGERGSHPPSGLICRHTDVDVNATAARLGRLELVEPECGPRRCPVDGILLAQVLVTQRRRPSTAARRHGCRDGCPASRWPTRVTRRQGSRSVSNLGCAERITLTAQPDQLHARDDPCPFPRSSSEGVHGIHRSERVGEMVGSRGVQHPEPATSPHRSEGATGSRDAAARGRTLPPDRTVPPSRPAIPALLNVRLGASRPRRYPYHREPFIPGPGRVNGSRSQARPLHDRGASFAAPGRPDGELRQSRAPTTFPGIANPETPGPRGRREATDDEVGVGLRGGP